MKHYSKEARAKADLRGLGLPVDFAKGKVTQVLDDEVVCLDFDQKVGHLTHLVVHKSRLIPLRTRKHS